MRRRRPSRPARRLRVSIDALPRATKVAMLRGIRETPIIAGAYTSREGTCPMLAAHRRGGRTSLATFARAWDGYARAERGPRPATQRELRTLEAMLEASLAAEEGNVASELSRAIAEHEEARARQEGGEAAKAKARSACGTPAATEGSAPRRAPAQSRRADDTDRTPELRRRPGWAWLRVFRRLDDYEAALAEADGGAALAPPVAEQHGVGDGASASDGHDEQALVRAAR